MVVEASGVRGGVHAIFPFAVIHINFHTDTNKKELEQEEKEVGVLVKMAPWVAVVTIVAVAVATGVAGNDLPQINVGNGSVYLDVHAEQVLLQRLLLFCFFVFLVACWLLDGWLCCVKHPHSRV